MKKSSAPRFVAKFTIFALALARDVYKRQPQQTAEARKLAADKLTADAEAAAERSRNEASAEMSSQISEANSQRAELVAQIAELNAQLQALMNAPIVPGPVLDPDDAAMAKAQQERAEQIAALQSALAGAQGGICLLYTSRCV